MIAVDGAVDPITGEPILRKERRRMEAMGILNGVLGRLFLHLILAIFTPAVLTAARHMVGSSNAPATFYSDCRTSYELASFFHHLWLSKGILRKVYNDWTASIEESEYLIERILENHHDELVEVVGEGKSEKAKGKEREVVIEV